MQAYMLVLLLLLLYLGPVGLGSVALTYSISGIVIAKNYPTINCCCWSGDGFDGWLNILKSNIILLVVVGVVTPLWLFLINFWFLGIIFAALVILLQIVAITKLNRAFKEHGPPVQGLIRQSNQETYYPTAFPASEDTAMPFGNMDNSPVAQGRVVYEQA